MNVPLAKPLFYLDPGFGKHAGTRGSCGQTNGDGNRLMDHALKKNTGNEELESINPILEED